MVATEPFFPPIMLTSICNVPVMKVSLDLLINKVSSD